MFDALRKKVLAFYEEFDHGSQAYRVINGPYPVEEDRI